MRFLILASAFLLAAPSISPAQLPLGDFKTKASKFSDVGSARLEIFPAKARRGEAVTLKLTVTPKEGCWTYPLKINPMQVGKTVLPPENGDLIFTDVVDPFPPQEKPAGFPVGAIDLVYKKPVTWEMKAWVSRDAKPGTKSIPLLTGSVKVQICNDDNCFDAKSRDIAPATLEVLDGEPVKLSPDDEKAYVKSATGGKEVPVVNPSESPGKVVKEQPKTEVKTGVIRKNPQPPTEYEAALDQLASTLEKQTVKREGGIAALLLTAVFWGFVSLATPCVFPMIPITVSLFLKQSNQSTTGAVKLATVYSLTIVVVLGISAVSLLSVFRLLSVNPWMNVALGVLFVVFALSLFGMYDITLPRFLLKGAESRRKQGGMVGTIFGAVAFSIVSFTCVAPFLGGFAGMAASGQYSQFELMLAGLTFAAAFATPFFVLALFPSLLKTLPKSGGWLDSVKAVMGFLEIAAALKFFRTAEIRWSSPTELLTYDLVIAGWVVISIACGMYLLNIFRLPHDEEKSHIGVPRLVFALLFLGFGMYLIPAAFKSGEANNRPRGAVFAWVDAFLLPESGKAGTAEFAWNSDLIDALDRARRDPVKKFVFVDFTGETCSNCKLNENEIFPRPEVKEWLSKYQLAQLYTDDVPAEFYSSPVTLDQRKAEGTANNKLQQVAFGGQQLPLYAILEPTPNGAKIVAVYEEGKINKPAEFVEFLKKPYGN